METLANRSLSRWVPYSAYRDSGLEWVGKIPREWELHPVKRHYAVQLGKMLQNQPNSEGDVSVPYIKALHVLWGSVDTSDLPEMWASPLEVEQYGVIAGDLIVCEGGEVGRAGIVGSAPSNCIIQNAVHRVRNNKGSSIRYLMYVLHAVASANWFDVLCNRATIAHFTGEKFADLKIPYPPPVEQKLITDFLDREMTQIDVLISGTSDVDSSEGKLARMVSLLQEYRATLISAAVTGKIDVRKEAT